MEVPQPWFTPQHTLIFAFAALTTLLILLEPYAKRRRHVPLVFGSYITVLLAGIAALVAAAIGLRDAQPMYVIMWLAVTGWLVTSGTAIGLAKAIRLYRSAADISR